MAKLTFPDDYSFLMKEGERQLKPCPFCGNSLIRLRYYSTRNAEQCVVWCVDCIATMHTMTLEDAISNWNRRTNNYIQEEPNASNPKS